MAALVKGEINVDTGQAEEGLQALRPFKKAVVIRRALIV
jgi:hypothetical protein